MRLGFRQWFLLILFSVLTLCSSSIHTLHAAFFPFVAETKNATSVDTVFAFATFDIAAVIFCPLLGSFIAFLGIKRMICVGTFIQAISVCLFGAVDDFAGRVYFTAFSILIRFIEGIGFAATSVSVYSIVPSEFPHTMPLIYSILTMWLWIGNTLGPFVGNLLYHIGGFICPFLTIGVILVVLSFFLPLIFWKSPIELSKEKGNIFKVLIKPLTLLNYVIILLVVMIMMFEYSTLPWFLRKSFQMNPTDVSWTFGIIVVIQSLALPFWGYLSVTLMDPQLTLLIGSILGITGTILSIDSTLLLTSVGTTVLAAGISALILAAFLSAMKEALEYGFLDNATTVGVLAGGFLGTISLGGAIGSLVAGLVYDTHTVQNMTYVSLGFSAVVLSLTLVYTGGSIWKRIRTKGTNDGLTVPTESTSLLGEDNSNSVAEVEN